jgi:hypothetical protein
MKLTFKEWVYLHIYSPFYRLLGFRFGPPWDIDNDPRDLKNKFSKKDKKDGI